MELKDIDLVGMTRNSFIKSGYQEVAVKANLTSSEKRFCVEKVNDTSVFTYVTYTGEWSTITIEG